MIYSFQKNLHKAVSRRSVFTNDAGYLLIFHRDSINTETNYGIFAVARCLLKRPAGQISEFAFILIGDQRLFHRKYSGLSYWKAEKQSVNPSVSGKNSRLPLIFAPRPPIRQA